MLFIAKTKDVIGDQETNLERKCFASGLICFSRQKKKKCCRLNTYGKATSDPSGSGGGSAFRQRRHKTFVPFFSAAAAALVASHGLTVRALISRQLTRQLLHDRSRGGFNLFVCQERAAPRKLFLHYHAIGIQVGSASSKLLDKENCFNSSRVISTAK